MWPRNAVSAARANFASSMPTFTSADICADTRMNPDSVMAQVAKFLADLDLNHRRTALWLPCAGECRAMRTLTSSREEATNVRPPGGERLRW